MTVRYHSVGPFEVLSRLGSGGMADVLKARDVRDGRIVAVKIPRADPDIREAERQGALLQKQLSEVDARVPAVYEIHDSAESEMYIVMEFVAGEDLADRIRRGPLEPREAVRIAIELCELLTSAQRFTATAGGRAQHGIVHGDLKPRNVRLEPGGGVKVLDFGIAKALSQTRALTRNEFGSLPYSSPERIDTGHVDVHSDLWSVSVVLYEMLTGQQPFRGDSTRRLEDFIRSRALPERLPDGCPPSLAAVIHKALAPTLAGRYEGPAALRDDLRAFLDGRPTSAQAVGGAVAAYEQTRRTAPAAGDEATRRSPPSSNGGADLGDTRRTLGAGGNGADAAAATRRTLAPGVTVNGGVPAATPAGVPAVAAPAAATPATPRRAGNVWSRIRWRRLVVIAAVLMVANEAQVISAAGELKSALPGLPRGESEAVWDRYRQLSGRSVLGVGRLNLSEDVKDWFVAGADELIADYRSDTPVIREAGWRDAAGLLGHAASIAPRDRAVRSRLLYCRGHLARIDGVAAKSRRPADARRLFNEAISHFEEASRLRPRWLDPHLGLARTYVYGLEDPEHAREALERAEAKGYELRSRDLALLGDGYRLRAERTWARAPDFRDQPQEEQYIESVRGDCDQALQHYETVPAYGDVSRSVRKVHELLATVEEREDELQRAQLRKVGLGFLGPLLVR